MERVVAGLVVCMLTSCTLSDMKYGPALPAEKMVWDNKIPYMLTHTGGLDLCPPAMPKPTMRPVAVQNPLPDDWERWQAPPVTKKVCAGKGKRRTCKDVIASTVESANVGALVKPTAKNTMGNKSGMIQYQFDARYTKIYQVEVTPSAPTYLMLPPGEYLADKPIVDKELWDVRLVEMAQGEQYEVAVAIRAEAAPQEGQTALLFTSGLKIFLKLVAKETGGMLTVAWTMPPPTTVPDVPAPQRPPKVDLSRLHRGYTIEVESKVAPPWMPDAVFDDGSKTFLHFREALTYTSGPAVFGVNQQGKVVPTASHMFVKPPTPEEPHEGAWMILPRLYPALQLKDSSNLSLRIIRQAPATGGAREQ
jgi:hypothetical protein